MYRFMSEGSAEVEHMAEVSVEFKLDFYDRLQRAVAEGQTDFVLKIDDEGCLRFGPPWLGKALQRRSGRHGSGAPSMEWE